MCVYAGMLLDECVVRILFVAWKQVSSRGQRFDFSSENILMEIFSTLQQDSGVDAPDFFFKSTHICECVLKLCFPVYASNVCPSIVV